jgi:hypothetical protein
MIRSISADAVVEGRSVSTAGALEYITDDDLRVVYHRVNALYVMVVTPASHNAFAAAAYLQHAVRSTVHSSPPCSLRPAKRRFDTDQRPWESCTFAAS